MNFKEELIKQGLEIPYSTNTDILCKPREFSSKLIPNRIGILPLEGFDSNIDGSPSEYVYRRYMRFASGGAGLIWFEACAVSIDGKSNPCQMMLTDENVQSFYELIKMMDEKSLENGREKAYKVLQLTHSGRMARDNNWNAVPISPKKKNSDDVAMLASDERIEKLVEEHIHSAILAAKAGFDAVDVKVCHGYFLSELLSSFHRSGKYGGPFENRTRAIIEIVDGIREQLGNKIDIAVRLNAYDSETYPDGYGLAIENGKKVADLSETIRLCMILRDKGVKLINISASDPNERVFGNMPSDTKYRKYSTACDYLMAVKTLKEKIDGVCFMCTGLSDFGINGGYIGAGGIMDDWFDIAGFGRQALAYPDFANVLISAGKMDSDKCCVNCNQCFKLMEPGHCRTGCIVKDGDEFYPLYTKNVLNKITKN